MASDGDQYQKRVRWGWGKPYKAACAAADATELAPSIAKCVENMLRSDLQSPALGPMIASVQSFFKNRQDGLPIFESCEEEALLRVHLDSQERRFADFESSAAIREACLSVVAQHSEGASPVTEEQVASLCCERYHELLFERGFSPMEHNIMKARKFSREQLEAYRSEAMSASKEQGVPMLVAVSKSTSGTVPKSFRSKGKPVENTLQGLTESL